MNKRLVLLAILASCHRDHREVAPRNVAVQAPPPAVVPQARHIAQGPSLYSLSLPLHAADGREIALDVHRGHPTVIAMFYGSCAMACPALIGYVHVALEKAGPDARVLLVSFDAKRDTPDKLAELATTHRLDARFTLASAAPDDARTLAAVLGFKYRETAAGEFVHNSVITVLDRDGRKLASVNGIGDASELVRALTDE